jgi:phospholipase/carboxylesterase
MIKNIFPSIIAGKIKLASLFLILLVFVISFGYGEKKNMPVIGEYEKIDPLDEKAVDFLDLDYDTLRRQANRFAGEKKYFEAAQCFLGLVQFNRNDSTSIYNLACCYGRLRKTQLAVKSLVMAVRAGFRDFELLKRDPDFVSVRDTPEFMSLLARIPDWEDSRGEALYIKTSKLLELRIKLPRKFSPSLKYPLLIGLHGNGGNPEQILATMNQALKNEALILAAPQGAYPNFPQLRGQHFSWEIQTRDRELWKIADPLAVENIYETVQLLKKKYPISEVYILGFSQGAAFAFLSGFKYPGLAAGIISIGGLFPETDTEFSILKTEEIESGKKIRVFIAQGLKDPSFPAGTAVRNAEKLKKYGYAVEYLEYDGGHEITPELLNKIYSWMINK